MTTAPGRTPHEVALIVVVVGGLTLVLWLATSWQLALVTGGPGLVAALAASYLRDKPEDRTSDGAHRRSLWCRLGIHAWQPDKQCADCGDWDE